MDPRRLGDFHSDLLRFTPPAKCCFSNDHLDDATFTFISTVSIAVTCSLYPAIHTIFLLLTPPYRPIHLIHAFKFHFILASFTCIHNT